MAEPFTVIVLAAQRAGVENPVAKAHGVSHKCLVPIVGRPLIAWVLDVVTALPGVQHVVVSVERDAHEALAPIATGYAGAPITLTPSQPGIADSVVAAAEDLDGPYIITTADNVLLEAGPVASVLRAIAGGADVVATLATRQSVLAAHPEAQRGFYAFADHEYANCNLYGIAGPHAFKAADIFREGGQFMKNPKRLIRAFGLVNILLMKWKLISLAGAMKRLSGRFGLRFAAVVPADGAQAIDVDNQRTYDIAEPILRARKG